MPRGVHYSIGLKQHIISAYKSGKSQKLISEVFGIKKDIVSKTIKRFNNRGVVTNLKRGGRKRKTTQKLERRLIRLSKNNPKMSARRIIAEVGEINVSSRTVQRRLVEASLKGRRPAKKPHLSTKNEFHKKPGCCLPPIIEIGPHNNGKEFYFQMNPSFASMEVMGLNGYVVQMVKGSTQNTLILPSNMEEGISWSGVVSPLLELVQSIGLEAKWIDLDTTTYWKTLCCHMPNGRCPSSSSINTTTTQSILRKLSRLGSRKKKFKF